MPKIHSIQRRLQSIVPALPVLSAMAGIILIIVVTGAAFFVRGRVIMESQLKEKLRTTAAVAAMQFDPEDIASISDGDTIHSSAVLLKTAEKLQRLRKSVGAVRYAYIMRKTDDPTMLAFIADADLLATKEELDRNKNGVVDDNEQSARPGELYDWMSFPRLGVDAFVHPTVDDHVGEDSWGPIISGYAPIMRENGEVVGVLGIDMDANEFLTLSNSIFSPIALLLIILATVCIAASSTLHLWHRRIEILDRLENERSGLLRLAFHQLGGPLTIINWSLEELEEEGPTSMQRTIVNIHEGVKRLSEILKMLKSADLVHAGKIDYKPEFASLNSVLEQVAKHAEPKLAVVKQKVILDLEGNITMNLDPKLIAGVAEELLSNAMDFSKDGATITIRSRHVGREVEFSIIDQGCGIPKSDLKRIFDEFSRGSNATKYKADGNGLGLYIVRGIVEQAGGKIIVTSKEGIGTTVTVRLPMAPAASTS